MFNYIKEDLFIIIAILKNVSKYIRIYNLLYFISQILVYVLTIADEK